jgi:hypothetical protein
MDFMLEYEETIQNIIAKKTMIVLTTRVYYKGIMDMTDTIVIAIILTIRISLIFFELKAIFVASEEQAKRDDEILIKTLRLSHLINTSSLWIQHLLFWVEWLL